MHRVVRERDNKRINVMPDAEYGNGYVFQARENESYLVMK
jgi:hypothetical protein